MSMNQATNTKGSAGVASDIRVATRMKEYSSFAADIDITAAAPGKPTCCRRVIISDVGAGTKVFAYTDATGTADSIDATNLQGVPLDVNLRSITGTTTTIAKVVVFW